MGSSGADGCDYRKGVYLRSQQFERAAASCQFHSTGSIVDGHVFCLPKRLAEAIGKRIDRRTILKNHSKSLLAIAIIFSAILVTAAADAPVSPFAYFERA